MTHPRALAPFLLPLLLACGSDGMGLVTVTVSGTVVDYFTGLAVSGVTVSIDGAPSMNATTAGDGSYTLPNVPATESLVLFASKTGYRPTRNVEVSAASGPVTADLAVVAVTDVQRQYTAVSLTPTGGMAVIFVELVDAAGTPRTGIPAAAITLTDGTLSPVGVGPFFFGAAGDIVPLADISQSTAFAGRARAAFLNVPLGTHTLRIAAGTPTLLAPVVAEATGATLVRR